MTKLRLSFKDALNPVFLRKTISLIFIVAAGIFLLRLAVFVIHEPFLEGDTKILVADHLSAIRKCLSAGRFWKCPDSGVWPLFQHVPSLALSYLGLSTSSILHVLAYFSFLSFVGSVVLVYWTLQKTASRAVAIMGVLIMITSPLLWYSHSTFGEMAAALVILSFTCACLMRAPWWFLGLLFVISGWTKELAFPFLFLIGMLCIWQAPPAKRSRYVLAFILGAAGTIIGNIAFNAFRFGTLLNAEYASKLYIVPTFKLQLSFFLGIWFSPNGGLLFFWPSFVIAYLAIVALALLEISRKAVSGRATRIRLLPITVISIILFVLTAGFARWYTPLGGAAWGPRYMIPWVPSLLVLLLYFYNQHVLAMLQAMLRKPIGLLVSGLGLFVISLPQFAVMYGHYVIGRIFSFPECPRIPIIQQDFAGYYPCIQTQVWPRTMVITQLYSVGARPPVLWFSICYCLTLMGGFWWLRRELTVTEINPKPSLLTNWENFVGRWRMMIRKPFYHVLFVAGLYLLTFVAFFFPAFYLGKGLAVGGDVLFIYLPNFYSQRVLWDTFIFSGFPMMADPQVMTWYPPAFFLSLIPHSWNVFMLLAYVAGSSFMYGYLYTLTQSKLAGYLSGLIFGLSGFMIAHLEHAVIIQAAAWIPLIIWSLENLRREFTIKWLVVGSLAVTSSFLGGHSQVFFYGLFLSVAYAITIGWSAATGWKRFYFFSGLMIALGMALAAIQFIPTVELVRQGARASLKFQDFDSYSLPPRQALKLIFPYVFGNTRQSGALPYFGAPNRTELVGYVGLLPMVLAGLGITAGQRKLIPMFWTCVAVLAVLLAMGRATPLARIIYHVPILNGFRVPARHFLEWTLAISILSGLGIAAIINQQISKRQLMRVIVVATMAMSVFLVLLFLNSGYMRGLAAEEKIDLTLRPWANHAVGIPLIIFGIILPVLIYWCAQPRSAARVLLLVSVLVIDLGSFGWHYDWRYFPSDVSVLTPPEFAVRYRNLLNSSHQRLIPYQSARGSLAEMPPNLTRMWGVPSAGGYNVLGLSRMSNLLPMIDQIDAPLPWTTPEDKALDILALRYLFLPQIELKKDSQGVAWSSERMQQWLGSGCGQPARNSLKFTLAAPFKSTSLAIVSRLACSPQLPNETRVARVQLIDSSGNIHTRDLLAGRDSSEWAADCNLVKPNLKHRIATIFSSYPAKMYDETCEGHFYITKLSLDAARDIKQIQIDWQASAPSSIIIEKMTVINDENHSSLPIDPAAANINWRLFEETANTRVYENLHASSRVWLASEIRNVTDAEALQAVKQGQLNDGRNFDPARIALVEGIGASSQNETDSQASAMVAELRSTSMVVRTSSSKPAFLLSSDAYYPGWRATVDGTPTSVYRADYAIRGVVVPAGEHLVRFEYRPRSFYVGAIISGVSAVALALMIAFTFRSSKLKMKNAR